MDQWLEVIDFHDCLHSFLKLKGRDTGMPTTEDKLAQQLVYLEQEAIFNTFIEMKKLTMQ